MATIVILGGGFGGIRAALDLDKKLRGRGDTKIILIDRNNYQTFQPSLYEVATAFGIAPDRFYMKLKATISIPYTDIFRHTRSVETIQAEISSIDLKQQIVATGGGREISFDYLIFALGSEISTYGIPGVMEYAYKFKTTDDALKLFADIESCYDTCNKKGSVQPIRFLIGGAGFNGIELASELSRCTIHMAHKHKLPLRRCAAITLLDSGPQILPMLSTHERSIIQKRLNELGIYVSANSPIAEIHDKNRLRIQNGQEIEADIIIWAAGVKAPEILRLIPDLPLDSSGRIFVDTSLRVKDQPHAFAIGDNNIFTDPRTQKSVPQLAYVAIEQAKIAARNIASLITAGESAHLSHYNPSTSVWIVPMGGTYAIARIGWLTITGFTGYLLRELVDMRYFISILPLRSALTLVKNRLAIFLKND